MNEEAERLRSALVGAFLGALGDLDPGRLVERALPPSPPEGARVRLVAAGKAALAMTRGALARWGDRIEASLVITTDGAPFDAAAFDEARVTVLRASHPLPDERSVRAAEAALAHVGGLGPEDVVLALISGGASALLSLPPPGMSLEDKRRVVRTLLEGGAPIRDVNLVRRRLSRIKGGRLALAAAPASVKTLVVSDVVDGAPHDVGSGPSVPDPTPLEEARAALVRYAPALVEEGVGDRLDPTPDPRSFPVRTEATILAGPEDFGRAVAARLEALGFSVEVRAPEGGDAAAVAARRAEQARSLAPGHALVIPCEPTVVLPAQRGRGGRAGWVALRAMRDLPPDAALLCGASDGADGDGGTAGAAVTRGHAEGADPRLLDEALAIFDDARAHRALGTAIDAGPTGHNLTDVHVIARAR
ncbi:glycerate kinase [Polyangium aurulentum]|uniref:glycerate kinase n=1 Tax=Polyangium aurulentum TaxID=2567896 RepID=UPI0010AE6CBE|nr:glycerate kinase [Polyangium aurulentum]UQA58865.1 glycerate kinase [Polyangium aurulentum]